jgi:hypothetical protein
LKLVHTTDASLKHNALIAAANLNNAAQMWAQFHQSAVKSQPQIPIHNHHCPHQEGHETFCLSDTQSHQVRHIKISH